MTNSYDHNILQTIFSNCCQTDGRFKSRVQYVHAKVSLSTHAVLALFSLSVSVLIMATARWRNSCWQYSAEYSGKVSQTIPSENELGWRKAKTWVGRWGWRRMKTICAPRACCCHLWLIHSGQLSSQDSAAGVTFFTERERRSRSTVEHASNWRGALTATQTSKAIITFCYFKSQIFDIVDCTFPCFY